MEMKTKRNRPEAGDTTRVADEAEAAACIAEALRDLSQGRGGYAMTPTAVRALGRARRGDHGALSFLYARYADDVYSRARMIVDDHSAALDITRRVFAGLTQQPTRCEESPEDLLRTLRPTSD